MTDYPPTPADGYELRATRRALADLDVPRHVPGGELDTIRTCTRWPAIVDKFVTQRTADPRGTEAPLDRMGRQDVYPLHGPEGQRAATWFDEQLGVVWLLGFTQEHDYRKLEDRADAGDLLPDRHDDEIPLVLERENRTFDERIGPGVRELARRAVQQPGSVQRGAVGEGLLKLDVAARVEFIDDGGLADLFISIRLPLPEERSSVPDWPAEDLRARVASASALRGRVDWPQAVPDGDGRMRDVDPATELVICLRDIEV